MRTRTAAVPLIVYVWCCSIFLTVQFISLLLICISDFGVVRWCFDIEVSVRAWYQKKNSTCTAAREAYSAAAASCSRYGRCAVCGITFKFTCKTKERFCANQNTQKSRRIQNTPTSKSIFLKMETPYMDLRAGSTRKLICLTYPVSSPQRSGAPTRRDRVSEHMPRRSSCVCLPECSVSRAMATGALEA